MKIICSIILVSLSLLSSVTLFAQQKSVDRIEELKLRVEIYAYDIPNLNKKVTSTVSGVSLYEFTRGIAIANKLNLNVDPTLDTLVSINLTDVSIKDLIVHICKEYNAELLLTGENILSLVRYTPPANTTPPEVKTPNISFNKQNGTLTYDLQNDSLGDVLKYITQLTKLNITTNQKLFNLPVKGYVENMPLRKAVIELTRINNLQYNDKDSSLLYIDEQTSKSNPIPEQTKMISNIAIANKIVTNQKDSIYSIVAPNIPIKDILPLVVSKLNVNYFLFADLKGYVDVKVANIDFNSFLTYIFNGTDYTYKYNNGIYLIGERKAENIRTSVVYKLKYRTTTKITEAIPSDLKKNVEIIPLTDLNSIVLSGSAPGVAELEAFLRQIDKSVPVVNIELIILDITKTQSISTGISTGINNSATTSSYSTIFPSLDVKLGANTINSVLNSINGGLINLGKVNANFYISLKASEDNGLVKIRSTPKLSTLNGTEAQMAIGETRYYAETTANVIATQSTTTVSAIAFKPLQANLSVNIKPIVSGDEQITLDITVDQGSFTNQISANGPYGQATRTFKSSIRVKNDEMILLGGLEQKSTNNSGKGVPFLSRIPVIKWLFSSRTKSDSKSKLAILIHPTVIF